MSSGSSAPAGSSAAAENTPRRPAVREPEDEREFQLITLEKTRLDFEEGVISFIPNPVRTQIYVLVAAAPHAHHKEKETPFLTRC